MQAVQLTQTLAALGDPTRRAVLEGLRGGERSVGELAKGLPVSRPAVSQHLAVLHECGLVEHRPAGRRRLYRIEPAGFEPVRAYVESFWTEVLGSYAAAAHGQTTEGGTP